MEVGLAAVLVVVLVLGFRLVDGVRAHPSAYDALAALARGQKDASGASSNAGLEGGAESPSS